MGRAIVTWLYGNDDDYELLFHAEEELSWETNEFVIVRRKEDGRVMWGSDSGCSCYEGFDEDNLVSGNRQELIDSFIFWNPDDTPQNTTARQEKFREALREIEIF